MDDFDWLSGDGSSVDDSFISGYDNSGIDQNIWGDGGLTSGLDTTDGLGDTEAPGWDGASGTGNNGTDWTNPNAGTGSSFPWTSALLQGGGAVLQGLGSMYKDKQDWKARTDFMKAQLAEQEKYYQLHGKQLADAYQGYKQFAGTQTNPTAGLLNPGGPSGYFH